MQSSAKCPFLLKFVTKDWSGPDVFLQNEINRAVGDQNDDRNGSIMHSHSSPTKSIRVSTPVSSNLESSSAGDVEMQHFAGETIRSQEKQNVLDKNISIKGHEIRIATNLPITSTSTVQIRQPLRSRKLYRNPRLKRLSNPDESASQSDAGDDSTIASATSSSMLVTEGLGKRTSGFTSPKVSFRTPSMQNVLESPSLAVSPKTKSKVAAHRHSLTSINDRKSEASTTQLREDGDVLSIDSCIFKVFDDCRQDLLTLQVNCPLLL
jgi:hypothetical protein